MITLNIPTWRDLFHKAKAAPTEARVSEPAVPEQPSQPAVVADELESATEVTHTSEVKAELKPEVITDPEPDHLGTLSFIPPQLLDLLLPGTAPAKAEETTMATAPVTPAPKETLGEKIKADFSKATAFLTVIGKDFEKGLAFAVKEAPVLDPLATLLFPAAGPEIASGTAALNLIQNSVLTIEQKYAASGAQAGTGTQKSAEVLTLAGGAVTQLLKAVGVANPTTDYLKSLVAAVVAILNAQPAPAAA